MGDRDFLAGKRCLVLDDEFLIALDIQHILEGAGAAAVTCAGNADAALAAIAQEPFDVAVLDVKLADGAGDSLCVAAALTQRATPFVFLTGLDSGELHARSFPAAPVLEKPYQAPLLLEAMRRALAI